jgi:hypothetical protein
MRAMSTRRSTPVEGPAGGAIEYRSPFAGNGVACTQTLNITPSLIIDKQLNHRSCKVFASLGPSSYAPEMVEALLDAGVSCLRIFTSQAPLVSGGVGMAAPGRPPRVARLGRCSGTAPPPLVWRTPRAR